MKKLLLALSVASLFAAPVMAEEVDILTTADLTDPAVVANTVSNTNLTINGQVFAPTCSITADDRNQTVTLDAILTTDILAGLTSKKDFNIDLENCPPVDKLVSLHFDVQADNRDGKHLKNMFTGHKADVSLKITHNGQDVDLSGAEGLQNISSYNAKGSQSYAFSVEYVKASNVNDTINPGLVQATLPVRIIYK